MRRDRTNVGLATYAQAHIYAQAGKALLDDFLYFSIPYVRCASENSSRTHLPPGPIDGVDRPHSSPRRSRVS
jgi:hypothetical protein